MMKYILRILLLSLCMSTVCKAQVNGQIPTYRSLDDLSDKKVATMTGCFQEALLEKYYPEMTVMRIDNASDLIQALLTRRCEAVVLDDYFFYYFSEHTNEIELLEEPLATAKMGFCFNKDNNLELRDQFNVFLKQIKKDGTYDEIYERWIHNGHNSVMPDIQLPTEGEPIRIATSSATPPLVFYKDGKMIGFDVEIATRFAAYLGRPIAWSDMNFSGVIPALSSGKQDIAIAGIGITPERQKAVEFSDPYFISQSLIAIRKENSANQMADVDNANKNNIFITIINSFRRNIIEEDRYMMILDGLKTTTIISLFSCLLGTILGALICWMRMDRRKALYRTASVYISLLRGTPILVLLMIMFYVVFAGTSIDAVTVSIITFGLNFAAYVSEMFRTSIESVDKGQTEAGIALGFTPTQTFCNIVMPQAFKHVLPIYKGEVISLVKMTSIVGYIAVQDLTKVGDIIRSRTFDAFFPLIMVAVLYFILSWIFAKAIDLIGKKACR